MSKHSGFKTLGKGLAGAVAIASGTSAYGTIITVSTPADLTNTPGGANTTVNWDVNGDAINDFIFTNRYPNTAPGNFGVIWQLNMNGAVATSGTLGYAGPFIRYAFALQAGASIGPAGNFNAGGQACLGSKYSYGSAGSNYYGGFAANGPNGSVAPGTFAFAGFKFSAADGVHFGWVKLAVNAGLIDFANPVAAAYESTPNTAIAAGAVPEPGTMSLLALGAAGVVGAVIKRRRS
jgi:hypothetical protein